MNSRLVQWVIKEKHLLRMLSDKRRWKICLDHSSMETRKGREKKGMKEREVGEAGTR